MLVERKKLYKVLSKDGRTKNLSESEFYEKYFGDEQSVKKLYNFLTTHNHKTGKRKGNVYVDYDITTFFKKYACGNDLSWTKSSTYCKSSNVTPPKPTPVIPPVTTSWVDDPTGSKLYVYKVKDCKWIAKNTRTSKESIISDIPKYQSSVDILNKAYPELIKKCKDGKPEDNKPEETKPPVVQIVLPSWADCLKTFTKDTTTTTDEDGNDVVLHLFGGDRCYFWKDGTAIYNDSKTKERLVGKWSCVGGKLLIKFDDWGWQWSMNTGWIEQPSLSPNAIQNYGTSWVSPSELTDDIFKENKIIMTDLENVISEINQLVEQELIFEQRVPIVQAPKDELNILRSNPMLKATGTLEALCRSKNQTSLPVNVNNKIYFAGKKVNLKSGGEAYLTYDGMFLQRVGQSCNFTYMKDANGLMHVKGIPYSDLDLQYTEVLTQFGINPKDYNSDPYALIDGISADLKKLVEVGAVSTVFKSWNDMLMYYHPDDYKDYALIPQSGKSLYPPTNAGELSQYRRINGRNYGLMYNDKDVVIYLPKNAAPQVSGAGNEAPDQQKCETAIVEYLSAAIRFATRQDPRPNPTINSADNRTFIEGCAGSGAYDKLEIRPDQLPKVNKDVKIFNFWRGKTLNRKNVYNLLAGRDKDNLPAGNNPYLPFVLDKTNESKSEIKNLIKENLNKISEEKKNKLLVETKIIRTRTNLLIENRILKFKKPREQFFNEIISESIYLEKQGFNKEIIKEEFWDKIKGLFGNNGSEAIFGTFKEYMSKWLVDKLTKVNPNGWMGTAIKKSVNEIHVEDIDKLTDCDFMTKRISLSMTDEILKKIKNDEELDGGISNIVKGGLNKSIDRTELLRSIEEGVSKQICPELDNVEKKLKEKAEDMKTKAIKP